MTKSSEINRIIIPDFFSEKVSHGFFGRRGGVSEGLFESLNCSPQSGDNPDHIAENRARVLKALGGASLATLKQIHSSECKLFSQVGDCLIDEGDALVTDRLGEVIGVLTADCAPVLLEGQKQDGSPVVGAAHAGWGGALKGVCESTVNRMVSIGAIKDTIKAAIGPSIGPKSYQVGQDFSAPFLEEDPASECFFSQKDGEVYFDLPSYVAYRLGRAGIGRIEIVDRDTYQENEDFFSFRRATHQGERQYGRQMSGISIIKT